MQFDGQIVELVTKIIVGIGVVAGLVFAILKVAYSFYSKKSEELEKAEKTIKNLKDNQQREIITEIRGDLNEVRDKISITNKNIKQVYEKLNSRIENVSREVVAVRVRVDIIKDDVNHVIDGHVREIKADVNRLRTDTTQVIQSLSEQKVKDFQQSKLVKIGENNYILKKVESK